MKLFIKKYLLPKSVLKFMRPYYHGIMAELANLYYGRPSEKLIVIGVTGTAGKSTTVQLLAHILRTTGKKTGFITTVSFHDGEQEHMNTHGLSMPGGFLLQRQLHDIVRNQCSYAVVECTSEGLAQNRHMGINFDAALFTNLAPAHIESHGSFSAYRAAKLKLFETTSKGRRKIIFGKKIIGVNLDNDQYPYFVRFPADKVFGVTMNSVHPESIKTIYEAHDIAYDHDLHFMVEDVKFTIRLIGEFNVSNALMAVGMAKELGVSKHDAAQALRSFEKVAGRMESIENNLGFQVFVDYAPEPIAMQNSLLSISHLPHNRIIHVFGATGGHRDVQKRFEFGTISAKIADVIVITNDDVYESDALEISQNIWEAIDRVPASEKKVAQVETILDRAQAIRAALTMAKTGDIVLITGKGSEQFLVLPGNVRIPWDEREVVKTELAKLQAV